MTSLQKIRMIKEKHSIKADIPFSAPQDAPKINLYNNSKDAPKITLPVIRDTIVENIPKINLPVIKNESFEALKEGLMKSKHKILYLKKNKDLIKALEKDAQKAFIIIANKFV